MPGPWGVLRVSFEDTDDIDIGETFRFGQVARGGGRHGCNESCVPFSLNSLVSSDASYPRGPPKLNETTTWRCKEAR
jgi:hypothetical protein